MTILFGGEHEGREMRNNHAAGSPLPRRAREARKARGWTQEETAERVGMKVRAYQMFENEQSWPQPTNFRNIVEVLGLEVEPELETDEPRWEPDIRAFLDMVGVYMEGLSDGERNRFILAETRRIFQQMRAVPATEREEAAEAMREELARRTTSEPRDVPRESERKA